MTQHKDEGRTPILDNPSGMYCPDCRATGLLHCSDPEHCGGMKPMAAAPVSGEAEGLAREIHALVCEGLVSHDCEPEIEAVAALLRPRMERAERWKRLPDEQAWWWHWNGENYAIPHVCSVMVSKTGPDRYFVADGHNAPWCDEMGGFWLKIGYPNVPSREQVKKLTALPSAPDTEKKA